MRANWPGLLLFAIVCSLASVAYAGRVAPLKNYENVDIVRADGKVRSLDEIDRAVTAGAKKKGWKVSDRKPGETTATLVVRNKHSMTVTIGYTEKTLSIRYKDSINMNYDPAYKMMMEHEVMGSMLAPAETVTKSEIVEVIHPNYNVWTGELLKAIQAELAGVQ